MAQPENVEDLRIELESLKYRVKELTDFIENGSMPLHWVNGDGIIIWANQAELDLLGYTKEEYIGFPIQNFHADSDIISELLVKLSNNETVQDFPASLLSKNGDVKYVRISSNVLIEDGKFIHTRCFTRDVTELVKEEKRKNELHHLLAESAERLRLAISASNLGIWELDLITGNIQISDELRQMLEIPIEVDAGGLLKDYIYPEDKEKVESHISDVKYRDNGEFDIIFRFLKSNAIPVWIRVQGIIQKQVSEGLHRVVGCVLDITDLKNSEEYHSKLVAIVNSSFDAIISKTLNGVVSTWNSSAETIFGYSADEMIGQPIIKIIPEERLGEEDYILEKLRAGESINHFETQRLTKSGKLLDVSLTISPIKNANGEIMGISKIARDISEKNRKKEGKMILFQW
ncbi:PAS domain S-box protein [Chryseobacterium indologenes]|nr:PAS domain S-box protein [Chryseobacterium indologenes]